MRRERVGAIRGRHPLPVDRYLFDAPWLATGPQLVAETRRNVRRLYERGIREVDFFPTGLTQVSVEAVGEMVRLGMSVRVFHYRGNGGYFPGPTIKLRRKN